MIITKDVDRKVLKAYHFTKGIIKIDADYFINKINESCASEDNLNHKTNIKGSMTPYQFFKDDPKFIEIVQQFIEFIDENYNYTNYHLEDAWGFRLNKGEKTVYHTHYQSYWSGAIYLNKSSQNLIFPDINEELKPEVGSFAIFSGFLNHGCEKNLEDTPKFGLSFNMMESKNI
jgi:hypothetical protein